MLSNGAGIWAMREMDSVERRLYERQFCNGGEERCMKLEVLKRSEAGRHVRQRRDY
jgi:hypothetical protein